MATHQLYQTHTHTHTPPYPSVSKCIYGYGRDLGAYLVADHDHGYPYHASFSGVHGQWLRTGIVGSHVVVACTMVLIFVDPCMGGTRKEGTGYLILTSTLLRAWVGIVVIVAAA